MPKRYILWSVLGGLGGIMVNSMRIESNRVDEIQYLFKFFSLPRLFIVYFFDLI